LLSNRVLAVFLEFRSPVSNDLAASWLVFADEDADSSHWEGYFRDLSREREEHPAGLDRLDRLCHFRGWGKPPPAMAATRSS
jgi:hypothetical protein